MLPPKREQRPTNKQTSYGPSVCVCVCVCVCTIVDISILDTMDTTGLTNGKLFTLSRRYIPWPLANDNSRLLMKRKSIFPLFKDHYDQYKCHF